jgi:hypothetical protein
MAAFTRSNGLADFRSSLSIRKASVTPVRNRKIAGAIPPTNCEITYGPDSRKSLRAKE